VILAFLLVATLRVGPPDRQYLLFVVSEAADQISLVRFGPDGLRVDHSVKTGLMPSRINGPHGVAVSADGKRYYVTVAHGTPFGSLWKYSTVGDTVLGRVELGNFPATVQLTPDGALAFISNFNLYGDRVPSSVSVVFTADMTELARIPTCIMPHGSRLNPQGTWHYSVCMMDDQLVEIDTRALRVTRRLALTGGHASSASTHDAAHCMPTWAQPSADGREVYVACNGSSEILDVDVAAWTLKRRLPAGEGVYNLAVTHNGRYLLGTNKRAQSVSVVDLAAGVEAARISTRRKVVHGVVVSPDDRYAFVTEEGVASDPGTVEVLDLEQLRAIASVDVGQQTAGIDFWKVEMGAP
jgi:DNA-binding beta-propeller fold protein YncE